MSQPKLSDLLQGYLSRRTAVPGSDQMDVESEVEPHQVVALAITDARQAFQAAVAAAKCFLDERAASAFQTASMPPGWAQLVRNQESMVAIPFCLGHYPQMLRDITPLLSGDAHAALVAQPARASALTDVVTWGDTMLGKQRLPESLIAAAVLRDSGQHAAATDLIQRIRDTAPASWDGLLQNEQAALAWDAGDRDRAAELWTAHPQAASAPVLFNRGLAALANEQLHDAEVFLQQAVDKLPQDGAWHHLGQLYRTFISSR